jgi:DNA (cytosine-5)-methyltransferase 1
MMNHLDLFSGIGGFAIAAQMVGGIETRQFVEIDPYCQKVLAKNFSGVPIHGDIATFTATRGQFDLITGGFPCQDISCANPNGRGLEGERSGLFYELMRIVRECRPRYLVLENVAEMLRKSNGRVMGAVLWELAESGFDAEWQTISAASVGAPHLRERVFIVAYRNSKRCDSVGNHREGRHVYRDCNGKTRAASQERCQLLPEFGKVGEVDAHTNRPRRKKFNPSTVASKPRYSAGFVDPRWNPWATEPGVLRVANGIPNRVDRIRGLGNAVVPQVAAIALQRVLELNEAKNA